jgi:hypothetical protein
LPGGATHHQAAGDGCTLFNRMETAMIALTKTTFKTKTLAAALAAVTLGTALIATSGAEARPRFGAGLGVGLAVGALVGAAASTSAYAAPGPVYVAEPSYRCHWEDRVNRWGYVRTVKVCRAY